MADVELPLTGHLEELRKRLVRIVLALVVGFAICYPNSAVLFDFLEAPLLRAASADGADGVQLIGTGVAEAFFTRLKVSIFAALFLVLPVILYQLWRFIVPGLRATEANYGRAFVVVGTIFFLIGSTFCYAVVFDFGFPFFLAEYRRIGVEPAIRISEYLSFASRLMIAFGITFELPVATFFLARIGLVTHTLLIRVARYAILVVFVLAAILTPPDVVSQVLMAGPLMLLYGLSIIVAYFFAKPRLGDSDEDPDEEANPED
jgi:sec-independent protein translocase protein TatC